MLHTYAFSSPRNSCKTSSRAGFTLIELLVVIAIIAILASILFPVFSQVMEKGRQASCSSNLKQIGVAFMMYEQDYDEQFPTDWVQAGSKSPSLSADQAWPLMLYPYVKSYSLFDCPSSPATVGTDYPNNLRDGEFGGNYVFNYDGLTYGANNMVASIQAPAETFQVMDGGDMICCAGANTYDSLLEELDLNLKGTNAWPAYTKENALRHFQRSNMCYVDGHVKPVDWTTLLTRKADLVTPWNIDWDDCSPTCPAPVAGTGQSFDPSQLP